MTDMDLEPGVTGPEVAGGVESVLDKIKKRRDSDDDFLEIDIPSWGGDLRARYEVVDRREIERMIRRAQARLRGGDNGGGDSGAAADADFLVKACIAVLAVDPEDGETKHILANGYEMSLVDLIKPVYPKDHPQAGEPVQINDPRELVIYMLRWNGIALASHGQDVARWMQTMKKPITDPQ